MSMSGMARGVLLCCIAMALQGCTRERPPAAKALRLGVQRSMICALPFVAQANGFFARAGLRLELVPYPSGKLAVEAMLAGEVDVATCADMPIMTHSFQRDDFALFATIAWTEYGAWIVARSDHGIAAPHDLRGKTVATQRNSAVHFFLSAFLATQGMDEEDIRLVFLPAVELPDALAQGRIDAFSMRNPFAAQARDLLHGQVVEMFAPHIYRQTFNLVAKKTLLHDDRDLCVRLLRALAAAEDLLIRNEAQAQRQVIAQLGAERAEAIRADWEKYVFTLTLDQSIFVTLEDQAFWAMSRGIQPSRALPNYLHFVDTGPLRAVKPEAVSIIR